MSNTCKCCYDGNSNRKDLTSHWDKTYTKIDIDKLGWYEANPEPSLRLIKKCNLNKNASILNVGTGASTLIDELIRDGYNNLIANDLSPIALGKLKERLGNDSNKVKWIVDDLTFPEELPQLDKVNVWHDRAVLHFLTEKHEQDCYFELLKSLVKKNGYVIIAVFNLNGATQCSGLPVYRFDEHMLHLKLGVDFELIESFNYTYTMPKGDTREYIYTLYKKLN